MSDEIKPALTAEEWAACAPIPEGDVELPHALNVDRHAAAALCLYGQPFGFTHADVAAISVGLEAIDGVESEVRTPGMGDGPWDDQRRALRSLAARIAALLPPETP